MQRLVVGPALNRRQRLNEVLEAGDPNALPNHLREALIPRAGPTEIPSTFKGVGIKLQTETGSIR